MEYLGDFAEDATVYIPFSTFTSNDPTASATITDLADADIKVHKDGSLTQIVTDGATVIINFDGITGNHLLTIDTSVDAAYSTGAEYQVRIEGTTVDGGTINAWIASFSIENRGVVAAKAVWDRVLTGGTHNITNSAGRRVRQQQEAGTYANGWVWLDVTNGFAGTTDFENGTEVRPVNSLANANTMLGSANLGLHGIHVASSTSITFVAAQENQEWSGEGWILAMGGQSINNSVICNAVISGISTGVPVLVHDSFLNACTWAGGDFVNCAIAGTQTLSAATEYHFFNMHHASSTTPIIDFGATVGATIVHLHNFHGAIQINNMGQVAGTDELHFSSSGGVLTIDASCVSGILHLSGTFKLINNGSPTSINLNGAVIQVLGVPVNADISADVAEVKAETATILNRIGDFAGSGLNTLKGFFQALFRKDAGVSGANLPSEINEAENATSGAYDATTDSQEALRDSVATQSSLDTKIPTNLSFTGADLHVTLDGEKVTLAAATHTGAVIPTVSVLSGHTAQSGDTFAELPTNFSDLTISVTTGRVTAGTVSDKTGYRLSAAGLNDILRTALTEGYAADGSAPTVEQFFFMLWSMLSEFAIVGTTITAKKLDGTTTSMTFSTDSSTDPTSITRAT